MTQIPSKCQIKHAQTSIILREVALKKKLASSGSDVLRMEHDGEPTKLLHLDRAVLSGRVMASLDMGSTAEMLENDRFMSS